MWNNQILKIFDGSWAEGKNIWINDQHSSLRETLKHHNRLRLLIKAWGNKFDAISQFLFQFKAFICTTVRELTCQRPWWLRRPNWFIKDIDYMVETKKKFYKPNRRNRELLINSAVWNPVYGCGIKLSTDASSALLRVACNSWGAPVAKILLFLIPKNFQIIEYIICDLQYFVCRF